MTCAVVLHVQLQTNDSKFGSESDSESENGSASSNLTRDRPQVTTDRSARLKGGRADRHWMLTCWVLFVCFALFCGQRLAAVRATAQITAQMKIKPASAASSSSSSSSASPYSASSTSSSSTAAAKRKSHLSAQNEAAVIAQLQSKGYPASAVSNRKKVNEFIDDVVNDLAEGNKITPFMRTAEGKGCMIEEFVRTAKIPEDEREKSKAYNQNMTQDGGQLKQTFEAFEGSIECKVDSSSVFARCVASIYNRSTHQDSNYDQ